MSFQKNILVNKNKIEINWHENEFDTIKLFIHNANKLKQMIERKGQSLSVHMKLSFSENTEFQPIYNIELPSEDDKSTLLHNLRPFILENENTYLPKIYNLLGREVSDENFKKYIKQQIKKFKIDKNMQAFHLSVDQNVIINSEKTLKLWLNSYEYHRDKKKIKDIQDLTSFLPFDAFEFFMIEVLLKKTKTILEALELFSDILDSPTPKLGVFSS